MSLHPDHLPADRQCLFRIVHVLPLESEQFSAAQSCRELHVVELELAAGLCFREEASEIGDGHGLHLLLLALREFATDNGIGHHQVFCDRLIECGIQHRADVGDCLHAQPLRLFS